MNTLEIAARRRSMHSLAVDRALNARKRYGDFNEQYIRNMNRSDVERWDTRGRVIIPPKGMRVGEVKEEKPYIPTSQEQEGLKNRFHKMSLMDQYKDLLTTRNVIKRKEQIKRWRENPRAYDVEGVDTQPKGVIAGRINIAHKMVGNIPIMMSGDQEPGSITSARMKRGAMGQFSYNYVGDSWIVLRKHYKDDSERNQVLAHELGHAYDRNFLGKGTGYKVSFRYGNLKPVNMDRFTSFGQANNRMLKIEDLGKPMLWTPVEKVTRTKTGYPYTFAPQPVFNKAGEKIGTSVASPNYIRYRQSDKELFADWFSGLINQKNVVKKESGAYYNVFKKSNKPLFKQMRMSDLSAIKPFMGGKGAKEFTLW